MPFTKTKVPARLLNMRQTFAAALKKAAPEVEEIAFNGVASSVRKRWYKTGSSYEAISSAIENLPENEVEVIVRSGEPYDVFGEYGTGRRGAANKPKFLPEGWNFGETAGIEGRFAFHEGLEAVVPQIVNAFGETIAEAFK